MNQFNFQHQNSNFIPNYPQNPQSYFQPYFQQLQHYCFLLQHLKPQFNQELQSFKQQIETITISSDEEQSVIKLNKPIPKTKPVISYNVTQQRTLDLDQLEIEGKIYENDSNLSPLQQQRVQKCLKSQKQKIQNRNQSLSPIKLKKKVHKPQKQPKNNSLKVTKQVQIGKQQQQYEYIQSSVKTKLIKVYTKNEQQLQKLSELLLMNFPNSNDEDAIRLLNVTGKSYDKAMDLIKENEILVQYMLETNKINEILEEDDMKTMKFI